MVHDAAAAELIPSHLRPVPVHESRHSVVSDDIRELSRWLSTQRCAVLNYVSEL